MPDVAFTCSCKCLFGAWKRDGEPWEANCPLCGQLVAGGIGPENITANPLRLPNDQYDYISAVDGSHISSKRAHRDHLKRHGLIEIGNEKTEMKPLKASVPTDSLKREMRDNLERMKSHGRWREV